MIKLTNKGDFRKTLNFLHKIDENKMFDNLSKFAQKGVDELSKNTPVDTGKTAASWSYNIKIKNDTVTITWSNSNTTESGIPVVVLIVYGHATGFGTYVEGRDFITPSMEPLMDEIADAVWREVINS